MDLDGTKKTRGGPSRWAYLLALAPAALGVAAMAFIMTAQLPKAGEGLEQIVVPGARELRLEPGTHTIFWEHRSVVDGRLYAVEQISGLTVDVRTADGRPVEVGWPSGSSTYSLYGREGRSIKVVQIEQAGLYRVSAAYADGEGPETVIAVGRGFMETLFAGIFGAIGSLFGGAILSIVVGVMVYRARRKARREASAPA